MRKSLLIPAAALTIAMGAPSAFAQAGDTTGGAMDTTAMPTTTEDDNDFPWGLLGLLGLAGLLGRKRNDHDTHRRT